MAAQPRKRKDKHVADLRPPGIQVKSFLGRLLHTHVPLPSSNLPCGGLSGGPAAGVAITKSVLGNSKVVLVDEPTATLSVAQIAQVLAWCTSLSRAGMEHHAAPARAPRGNV